MADRPITTGPVRLTVMMGPRIAVPVARAVADAVLSVQVTVASGQRSGFQLAFGLARRGLINTSLLPGGYFDPKTRVILTVTVQGTATVLMDGVIIRQEVGISNQPGQSTLTVTGEDLTVLMDLEERGGCAVSRDVSGRAGAGDRRAVRAVRYESAGGSRAHTADADADPARRLPEGHRPGNMSAAWPGPTVTCSTSTRVRYRA